MKKLLVTAALVTAIASPALAQSVQHKRPASQSAAQAAQTTPYGRTETRRHSANPANDVYDASGHYVGSDPDARIRMELLRDRSIDAD